VLSHTQLARLLDGTPQRRYNLVNRALRHGELLQLRRGLYLLARDRKTPHPFVLAQALQPGSYVSFETALGFHGWIPESVPVTLSVTPGPRSVKVDHAVLGLFRFFPLAIRPGHFLATVDRCAFAEQAALVAHPLRALADIICFRKLEEGGVRALARSLRIDTERLMRTQPAVWRALERVYAHKRMTLAIRALRETAA
jgi:predicted transcriptional regulator of viral defense system